MNTSPQPFQLWPSWYCIKNTSKRMPTAALTDLQYLKSGHTNKNRKQEEFIVIFLFMERHTLDKKPQTWCRTRSIPANNSCLLKNDPAVPKLLHYWGVFQTWPATTYLQGHHCNSSALPRRRRKRCPVCRVLWAQTCWVSLFGTL